MKEVNSDLQNFSDFTNLIDRNEIDKLIILKKLNRNWEELVGPVLANHSFAKDLNSSSLIIETSHSAYSQELHFQNKKILEYIKSNSKFQHILNIKCTIGKIPQKPKKQTKRREPNLKGKEKLVESLDKIKDQELKEKLLKIVEVME